MKTEKLNIFERLMLSGVLPATGNLRTMRVVAELHRDLGFTAEELAKWNIRESGPGQIAWGWTPEEIAADPAKGTLDMTAEINVDGEKYVVIVEALRALDTAGKVEPKHLCLFEKFPLLKAAE